MSIDYSTIGGHQQWGWIMNSFCSLYNGADLSVDRIFTMFQIHMAFTDRNENDSKKLFKFGVLDAYCEMTGRNRGLSKKKQNWVLNLDTLQSWVTDNTRKLENDTAVAPFEPLKTNHDGTDDRLETGFCGESIKPINSNYRKRSREEPAGAEKDLEDREELDAPPKKRKIKASSRRKSKKGPENLREVQWSYLGIGRSSEELSKDLDSSHRLSAKDFTTWVIDLVLVVAMADQPSKVAMVTRRSSLPILPDVSSTAPESSTNPSSELVQGSSGWSNPQCILPSGSSYLAVPSTISSNHESTLSHHISPPGFSKHVDLPAPYALNEQVSTKITVNVEDGFTSQTQDGLDTATSLDLVPPPNGMQFPAQTQSLDIALSGLEPQGFTSPAQFTSTDSAVINPNSSESHTSSQSKSLHARNPAQAAAETDNRSLIPLHRKQEGCKMFSAGYNHRIFIEAAKIMADEALEEFFDFKAYAGQVSNHENTEMEGTTQESSSQGHPLRSLHKIAKDNAESGVEDEVMRDVEESEGNASAAHCDKLSIQSLPLKIQ
ncbi:hypothetical protein BKA64DRAFT_637913 [Cadophora sp. MPI-SDFR-AT-0126]|nr:hypothetical protein BKA64DRAFT_637913 [Leotiomycetes sp. MPI-SDFR-AT-0126]